MIFTKNVCLCFCFYAHAQSSFIFNMSLSQTAMEKGQIQSKIDLKAIVDDLLKEPQQKTAEKGVQVESQDGNFCLG